MLVCHGVGELVTVLYDFCNVDGEFSETGSTIFLHYPARIRVYRVGHDGRE